MAAALGDDENFASTVTASIATKADDAATTAALATKATAADVTALDTFVKGTGSTHNDPNITDPNVWNRLSAGGSTAVTQGDGSILFSPKYSFANYGIDGWFVQESSLSDLVVGNQYSANMTVTATGGDLTITVGTFANNQVDTLYGEITVLAGITTDVTVPFTAVTDTVTVAYSQNASAGVPHYSTGDFGSYQIKQSVTGPSSLDTTASGVVPAINELHTEVDALTVAVASTADSTAVVDAIATSKSEAISTASADATSKANAAQAAAEATASADATSKANAAQTAAEAYADSVGTSAVASVIDAAPATLDTLNELAAALGDDANFASTVTASIATKADDTATTAALATKASQVDLTAETSRATSAETINNQAIAILQNQVSGISTSSGSSNIEMTADVDMSTNKVSNLGTPTSGTDATTKAYVDSASSTETAARIAGDAANSAEVTAAIATASADATAKADSAEADAKAYADQVVAATVDAAPAALDTLNELAAALGDDANFASTVTASIATKADDAATTAALATKEDKTCLLYTSPSPRDVEESRMPSSA